MAREWTDADDFARALNADVVIPRERIDERAKIVAVERGCSCDGSRGCGCWNRAFRLVRQESER